jgi:hypothetical protein
MAEVRDPASELEAAELAAGSGDFTSAEQHLSRAVELEELSFGPMHAELASVLNNLGIVYERLDRPEKAEACYRRAYGIAKASLPEGDPGIELSASNLREFCTAKGIPFDKLPAVPVATQAATIVKPERAAAVTPPEPEPEPALSPAPRTLAIAALAVIAVAGVIFLATRSSSPTSEPAPAPTRAITPAAPVQEPVPVPAAGTPAPVPAAPATRAAAPAKPAPVPAPPVTRRAAPIASAAVPTLVSAEVCRSLNTSGDWHCAAIDGTTQAGPIYFYTRLKSPADTAVEHRWYHGARLQQKMTLRIRANQGTGYRTYSRRTVGAAGEWKVELRAADGTLLDEKRFTVEAAQD